MQDWKLWTAFASLFGPVHTGRVSRFARRPFDVACNLPSTAVCPIIYYACCEVLCVQCEQGHEITSTCCERSPRLAFVLQVDPTSFSYDASVPGELKSQNIENTIVIEANWAKRVVSFPRGFSRKNVCQQTPFLPVGTRIHNAHFCCATRVFPPFNDRNVLEAKDEGKDEAPGDSGLCLRNSSSWLWLLW